MGFETPKELTKGNHPSLPHGQMPEFIAALQARKATAALALELLILTNVRTNAVLQAKWPEFNLDKALWTVPLVNLKDREHRKDAFEVPLGPRAVEIVREMEKARVSSHVFPGQKRGKPLSNMAFLTLLKRMNARPKAERPDPDAMPRWRDPVSGRPITAHGSAPPSRHGPKRSRPSPTPRSSTRWATRSAVRSSAPTPGRLCSKCAGSSWRRGRNGVSQEWATLSRSDGRKMSNDEIFSDAVIKKPPKPQNCRQRPIAPFSAGASCAARRSFTAKRLAGRPPQRIART